jgi:cobalt/nickel transport system permease protein
MLRLLARLRQTGARRAGAAMDTRVLLASTVLFVTLVSLSRTMLFLSLAGTVLLLLVSAQPPRAVGRIVSAALAASLFTGAIMIPAMVWGDAPGAARTMLKVAMSVAAVALLGASRDAPSLTRGLSGLGVPAIFALILDITLRSLAILGRTALAMLVALRLRSVGRNDGKAASLGGVAGTLFLKSRHLTEETHAAMECRGFTGGYRTATRRRLSSWNLVPLIADAGLIALFFFAGAR